MQKRGRRPGRREGEGEGEGGEEERKERRKGSGEELKRLPKIIAVYNAPLLSITN